MTATAPITVTMTYGEAAIVHLALAYFIRQRDKDLTFAPRMDPDLRRDFVSVCEADQAQARTIRNRVEQAMRESGRRQ